MLFSSSSLAGSSSKNKTIELVRQSISRGPISFADVAQNMQLRPTETSPPLTSLQQHPYHFSQQQQQQQTCSVLPQTTLNMRQDDKYMGEGEDPPVSVKRVVISDSKVETIGGKTEGAEERQQRQQCMGAPCVSTSTSSEHRKERDGVAARRRSGFFLGDTVCSLRATEVERQPQHTSVTTPSLQSAEIAEAAFDQDSLQEGCQSAEGPSLSLSTSIITTSCGSTVSTECQSSLHDVVSEPVKRKDGEKERADLVGDSSRGGLRSESISTCCKEREDVAAAGDEDRRDKENAEGNNDDCAISTTFAPNGLQRGLRPHHHASSARKTANGPIIDVESTTEADQTQSPQHVILSSPHSDHHHHHCHHQHHQHSTHSRRQRHRTRPRGKRPPTSPSLVKRASTLSTKLEKRPSRQYLEEETIVFGLNQGKKRASIAMLTEFLDSNPSYSTCTDSESDLRSQLSNCGEGCDPCLTEATSDDLRSSSLSIDWSSSRRSSRSDSTSDLWSSTGGGADGGKDSVMMREGLHSSVHGSLRRPSLSYGNMPGGHPNPATRLTKAPIARSRVEKRSLPSSTSAPHSSQQPSFSQATATARHRQEAHYNLDVLRAADGYTLEYSAIDICERIGSGKFGTVFRGQIHGRSVAVKKLQMCNRVEVEKVFVREVNALRQCQETPSVVNLVGVTTVPYCIVMEYWPDGSLYDYLFCGGRDTAEAPLSWVDCADILKGVADALRFLHYTVRPSLIHRDVTTRNILIRRVPVATHSSPLQQQQLQPQHGGSDPCRKYTYTACLADFGIAVSKSKKGTPLTPIGRLRYMVNRQK